VVTRSSTLQIVVESYGKILTEGTHYTLTNNANTGAVTITGIGDYYSGSNTVEFSSVLTLERVVPSSEPDRTSVVFAPVVILAGEFTAGPNPVAKSSGNVGFFRQGKRIVNCELRIYDATGNVVNKVKISDKALGSQARRQVGSWDLTDSKGRQVSEGTYLVKGVLKMSDGKTDKVSVIVGVR